MEEKLLDISEKLGNVNGRQTSLESKVMGIDSKMDILHEKIEENTKLTASLRSTVAGLASGVSIVFTIAASWVWDLISGKR